MDNKLLAELLFGDIKATVSDIIEKYPRRALPDKAEVTRFSPSPTGYMHIGGLYAAMISSKLARQSGGVFYLRIEDTDKKREVEHGTDEIIESLKGFGVEFDEGAAADGESERGEYGPYRQSARREIYRVFAKDLVEKGLAYPCFCTAEELEEIRRRQEAEKLDMGYYGEYAKCRGLTLEEIKQRLAEGKEYVLRLRSPGKVGNKIVCRDIIRGNIEMPENITDVVLLKSDGIPTYHYAHVVDDFLMGTTTVIRGDEWISSYPIHHQLFEVSGLKLPRYAHIAPIMKLDGGENKKRKLSKRKDPEASVSHYSKQGYPVRSVMEYLMTVASSGFEEWRMKNPDADISEYRFKLEKMPVSGALFDTDKLNSVSRDVIAKMSEEEIAAQITEWAREHDPILKEYIAASPEKFAESIKLWRYNGKKVRKDVAKWSELTDMFDYLYCGAPKSLDFDEKISCEKRTEFLKAYIKEYDHNDDSSQWFERVKQVGEPLGFCPNIKEYKAAPESYVGSVADACGILRAAVTGKRNSPDLYTIMQLIGKEETLGRLNAACDK